MGAGSVEHQVKVDVEALLDDLSCDDDVTLGTARGPLPEKFEHASITRGPFGCKETRVQQGRLLAPKKRPSLRRRFPALHERYYE